MVLNLYSNGYSAVLGETVVRQAFGINTVPSGTGGGGQERKAATEISCGELVLEDSFGKKLPLSIFVRLGR